MACSGHNPPLERTAAAVYFTCGPASRLRRPTALRYVTPAVPALRCVFGQNAAGYQVLGLITIAVAIAVLLFASTTVIRVVAWVALPVGIVWYVLLGHAFIYSPFLWVAWLRELVGRRGR